MRTRRSRRFLAPAVALLAAVTALPASAADRHERPDRDERPSHGGLSAVIRYTEHGIPHILADDYADLGFGTGWAQAADQVCTLADGFVTVRGERSRFFGPDAATDGSLSSASTNLASDLYFRGVREAGTVEKLLRVPAPRGPSGDVKELMRGFAAGYNAWLAQNRITDPACRGARWVRPVTALDVAARGFAISVLGGQGRAVDGITAAAPPAGKAASAGVPTPTPPRGPPGSCSRPATRTWGPTPWPSAAGRRRTAAVCCSATRTTRGTGAAASGSRSRRSPGG